MAERHYPKCRPATSTILPPRATRFTSSPPLLFFSPFRFSFLSSLPTHPVPLFLPSFAVSAPVCAASARLLSIPYSQPPRRRARSPTIRRRARTRSAPPRDSSLIPLATATTFHPALVRPCTHWRQTSARLKISRAAVSLEPANHRQHVSPQLLSLFSSLLYLSGTTFFFPPLAHQKFKASNPTPQLRLQLLGKRTITITIFLSFTRVLRWLHFFRNYVFVVCSRNVYSRFSHFSYSTERME